MKITLRIFFACLLMLAFVPIAVAQMRRTEQTLKLGLTDIKIRVYTNKLPNKLITKTFVVVHHNEQKGLMAAKEVIGKPTEGGRLVEVVSNDNEGKPQRYLHFDFGGRQNLCVDPNRIYSIQGLIKFFVGEPKNAYKKAKETEGCTEINSTDFDDENDSVIKEIFRFSQELLKIVTDNNKVKFIVGVHNNTDGDLSVDSWAGGGSEAETGVGIFLANDNSGNKFTDKDNFILVSNLSLFSKILGFGEDFNLALQKNRTALGNFDDGSMSIYFGRKAINYVNIEAQGKRDENENDIPKKMQIKAISLVNRKL